MVYKMFLRLIKGPQRSLIATQYRQFGLFDRIFKKEKKEKEATIIEDNREEPAPVEAEPVEEAPIFT